MVENVAPSPSAPIKTRPGISLGCHLRIDGTPAILRGSIARNRCYLCTLGF